MSQDINDAVDVGLGFVNEFALHFAEFVYGELQVLGHLGEVLVILLVKNLNELFDDEYIEVVDSVFEDVDALVLDYGFMSKCLIYTSVLRDEFGFQPVSHLFV